MIPEPEFSIRIREDEVWNALSIAKEYDREHSRWTGLFQVPARRQTAVSRFECRRRLHRLAPRWHFIFGFPGTTKRGSWSTSPQVQEKFLGALRLNYDTGHGLLQVDERPAIHDLRAASSADIASNSLQFVS